jgi:hypothetical protein
LAVAFLVAIAVPPPPDGASSRVAPSSSGVAAHSAAVEFGHRHGRLRCPWSIALRVGLIVITVRVRCNGRSAHDFMWTEFAVPSTAVARGCRRALPWPGFCDHIVVQQDEVGQERTAALIRFTASCQRLIFRGGCEAAVQAHAPAAGIDDRSVFVCEKQFMRCAV